jgi:hypothetical protein
MAGTFTTFNAIFKEVYANDILEIVPNHDYLVKNIKFNKSKKLGKSYEQAVALSREWGFTFNSDGSAATLNSVRDAAYGRATISGIELCMRGQIAYAVLERSIGDKAAFAEATALHVKNLAASAGNIVEHVCLYGNTPVASVGTVAASGTSGSFIVDEAQFAEGFWIQAIGCPMDVFTTTSTAAATNTTAAIVITGVTPSTRTVTFSCASGDAAALDAETTAVVYLYGAKSGATTYRDFLGLDGMVSATSLFGISTSTYNLWKPRTFACGSAALTIAKVQNGLASCVNAGLNEDIVLLVNPRTWSNLNNELTALRQFDYSYDPAKNKSGAKSIEYFSQNGKIEVVSHPFVKQGEAFAFPVKAAMRIGSRDLGFGAPGQDMRNGPLFHLESSMAVEFRLYTDQALFIEKPGALLKFTGITNT